jgi:hypothetical protein
MHIVSNTQSAARVAAVWAVVATLALGCPAPVMAQGAQTSAGTRPPVTNCPPVKAQPSNAGQIAHMIQCAREGTRTGTVTLLTNIKVEFGATRRYIEFTDKGNYGIDPAAPA